MHDRLALGELVRRIAGEPAGVAHTRVVRGGPVSNRVADREVAVLVHRGRSPSSGRDRPRARTCPDSRSPSYRSSSSSRTSGRLPGCRSARRRRPCGRTRVAWWLPKFRYAARYIGRFGRASTLTVVPGCGMHWRPGTADVLVERRRRDVALAHDADRGGRAPGHGRVPDVDPICREPGAVVVVRDDRLWRAVRRRRNAVRVRRQQPRKRRIEGDHVLVDEARRRRRRASGRARSPRRLGRRSS